MACCGAALLIAAPASPAQQSAPAAATDPTPATSANATQMNDAAPVGKVMLDQLEFDDGDASPQAAWDAQAWYGGDYNKLWLKSEGEWLSGFGSDARYEALWDHAALRWWDAQLGVRYDLGRGPARGWAALGLQGLAPYDFDVESTLYVGADNRTAVRLRAEHDLLFTQRLILQPELETDLYGSSDPARQIGAGLSDIQLALRLRYEIRRELAPYIGLAWRRDFAGTARLSRAAGIDPDVLQWVAGVHLWF